MSTALAIILMIAAGMFLAFVALPVLAFVVSKFVALGWRRGNQAFDQNQQEREQDGIDQKRA